MLEDDIDVTIRLEPAPIELAGVSLIGPQGPAGDAAKGAVRTVNGIAPDDAGNVQTLEVVISRAAYDLIADPDPRITYYLTDN